jgi:outer membrane protein TolC
MNRSYLVCLFFFLFFQISNAQIPAAGRKAAMIVLDEKKDLQDQMIPLDSIIFLALKNSPSVKFQSDLIETAEAQLTYYKRAWSNNIVGFVNYSSGNQSLLTADNTAASAVSSNQVTSGYRVGVQMNIPLFEFLGRKAKLNTYKTQLNSTVDKKAETTREIEQVIIQTYYSLLYYNNLLSIRSEAKQTVINQYGIAQQQFKDGLIDIAELSRLKSIEVNARADYEEAKREFATLYFQLESMVGVPFQQLIRQK